MTATTSKLGADMDELINLLREIRPNYGDVGSRDADVRKRQEQIDLAIELLARQPAAIGKEANQQSESASDLAFSVYSGINALRWLLNITTEFDRKDVRTRQAARLLDEYTDSFGKTNRDRLEAMWKALNDSLPNDGRINEYLRAHDAAGRAASTSANVQDERGALPLSDFREGQWWISELDAWAETGSADQKRAVAVVHRLLRAVRAASTSANVAQGAEAVYQIRDDVRMWIDVDAEDYERCQQEDRRIVYTAPPAQTAITDDARECLMDVVSHHHDFRTACIEIKAANETTRSDELYWQKQIDVLDRMKGQAERALKAAQSASGDKQS
jgi:hypothetical protein